MKALNLTNVTEQQQGKPIPQLPVGAYECMIMGVKDNPNHESMMLSVEIVSGEHKGHYTKTSDNNDVRYGVLFVNYGNDQFNSIGKFKGFVTALEHSNPGFKWDGTNEFAFIQKRIGIVFGEKERECNGAIYTNVVPRYPISLERLNSGDYTIPKKKTVAVSAPADNGMTKVENEKLPWEQ